MKTDEGSPTVRSVLIVEDEVLIRLDLGEHLRSAGLTVLEAATADEAIAVLESIDSVGVVVSDVRMPGRADGLDLLGWVRRERPGVKVILISGYIPNERMRTVADLALSKPADCSALHNPASAG